MLKALARQGLHLADGVALALAPNAQMQSDALVAVLFHSLYRDRMQLSDPALAPNQDVTVEDFRAFVGAMLERGYTAVSAPQIEAGLAPGGKYLAITFDDGYFNNTLALGVLREFQVPATFFVSAHHVLQGKAFWWDAFSRATANKGASPQERDSEIRRLKSLPPDEIDRYLLTHFGDTALRPHSDLDRPFTPGELRDFARNPWVHVGNHTCDHAILANCTAAQIEEQIGGCQQALHQLVGDAPVAIAYPNGDYSREIVDASLAAGLRAGFTVLPHRNKLPLTARGRMTLGRFLFEGGRDARAQCRKFSAGFVPSHVVKTLIHSPPRDARGPRDPQRHA